jgi:hypothetical protein
MPYWGHNKRMQLTIIFVMIFAKAKNHAKPYGT